MLGRTTVRERIKRRARFLLLVGYKAALPAQNARLRWLVADLSLDKEMLQEVIRKKL